MGSSSVGLVSLGLAVSAVALAGMASPVAAVVAALAALALTLWVRRTMGIMSHLLERERSRAVVLETTLETQRNAVDVLAEGLDIAVFLCDARSVILYANPMAIEMFRFPEPAGRTVLAVTLSYELEHLIRDCVRTGQTQRAELTFAYPEGRTAVAESWPEPGGERIFLSLYETTDLRRLERVRQDFVANVSHELRTPLTTIRAMAETLQDEPDDRALAKRYLAKITDEVDRLSLIANDLLILSAAESNPVRKHACDIAEIFKSVVQQLQLKADERKLNLEYIGPDTLKVEANGAQINQVAINLIDNALNYTVKGSVKVTLAQDADQVVVTVQDTGIGIAEEFLPRIFERFYRVDKGRSRASGGTGLGLSIVKHIVEAHGGQVNVQSILNEGSTFIVRLPVGHVESGSPTPDAA